jgi:methylated-DNA-[protein]-cysteine S-methyltransferase
MTALRHRIVPSPVGALGLVAEDDALVALRFEDRATEPVADAEPAPEEHAILDAAARELSEYFSRARRRFTVPLRPHGTEFQLQVWAALRDIPYGETRSYVDIARALGRPGASRAVGAANHANPIALIVPCHRVIGSGGALAGYAGGVEIKRWLLAHERWLAGPLFASLTPRDD